MTARRGPGQRAGLDHSAVLPSASTYDMPTAGPDLVPLATGGASAGGSIQPDPTDQPMPPRDGRADVRVSLGWLLAGIVPGNR